MKKYKNRIIKGIVTGALAVFLMTNAGVTSKAAELSEHDTETGILISPMQVQEEFVDIADAAGLLALEENPNGRYRLVADIDMTGVEWKPFPFHGVLEGQGFTILNLTVSETGESVWETFDGNMKVYDTYFAGLFDELSGGEIRDLNLLNLRIAVETDQPCFIGGFAGYMEDSLMENCSVQGILELRAHDRMFGVGGMIGYGKGMIRDTTADVTLVCIDTDRTTKDEQFMGGVCAAGYPDIKGCTVNISGFDSDHGYVHDGGLVGMYMFYPKGTKYKGSITDNKVTGKITFFEDNKNRRAYCTGFIGEIMNWDFENGRNKDTFQRDEVFQYDKDLLPHSCENPVMKEEVVDAGCEFGYTIHTCENCGYTERDHFTLRKHAYDWVITKEASVEEEGERRGTCVDCGAVTVESIPKLIPEPTATPVPTETELIGEGMVSLTDGVTETGESALDGKTAEGKKIWTVPKVGKMATAGIAIVVTFAAFGIVWILTRRKN